MNYMVKGEARDPSCVKLYITSHHFVRGSKGKAIVSYRISPWGECVHKVCMRAIRGRGHTAKKKKKKKGELRSVKAAASYRALIPKPNNSPVTAIVRNNYGSNWFHCIGRQLTYDVAATY